MIQIMVGRCLLHVGWLLVASAAPILFLWATGRCLQDFSFDVARQTVSDAQLEIALISERIQSSVPLRTLPE
jgi:hypothetical protein